MIETFDSVGSVLSLFARHPIVCAGLLVLDNIPLGAVYGIPADCSIVIEDLYLDVLRRLKSRSYRLFAAFRLIRSFVELGIHFMNVCLVILSFEIVGEVACGKLGAIVDTVDKDRAGCSSCRSSGRCTIVISDNHTRGSLIGISGLHGCAYATSCESA